MLRITRNLPADDLRIVKLILQYGVGLIIQTIPIGMRDKGNIQIFRPKLVQKRVEVTIDLHRAVESYAKIIVFPNIVIVLNFDQRRLAFRTIDPARPSV